MRARISAIESKADFKDGQRRIVLKFDGSWSELRIAENKLGIVGLSLDDEVEVSFHPIKEHVYGNAAD